MAAETVSVTGQVGLNPISEGTIGVPFGQDRLSGLVSSFGLPMFHNLAKRGRVFFAAAQAAVTFGAGLSATSVWTLFNPAASLTDAVILKAFFMLSAPPAAASVIWLTGPGTGGQLAPTATTELSNWGSGYIGTGFKGSNARIFTAATLAAVPIIIRPLLSVVAATSITPPVFDQLIYGSIILAPGSHVTMQASAAAAGFPGFVWAEVPSP